jgi:hypothetical protein
VDIGVADAVRALRDELTAAIAAGRDEDLRFRVGPVEMEFQVAVARETSGSGKIRFWVVDMGASGKVTSTATHKVKLSLEPISASGGDIDVAGYEETLPE